jgi:hypothetical protein
MTRRREFPKTPQLGVLSHQVEDSSSTSPFSYHRYELGQDGEEPTHKILVDVPRGGPITKINGFVVDAPSVRLVADLHLQIPPEQTPPHAIALTVGDLLSTMVEVQIGYKKEGKYGR